jgi:predicted nucleotidyltransferase component of viral defense system
MEGRCELIEKQEISELARELSLGLHVVEKDYVLGWLLAGIAANTELSENWVFKGGTCLKKCYFETYRFSEDLDFTVTEEAQLDEDYLLQAFRQMAEWVYEQSGIEIPSSLSRLAPYSIQLLN